MINDDIRALAQQQADSMTRLTTPGLDLSSMPTMSQQPEMPQRGADADQHNFIYNALRSGWNNAQAVADQSVAAGLKLVGADQTSRDWSKSAAEQSQEAQRFNMPELQAMPGDPNFSWTNLPKQAVYVAAQNLPFLAAGAVGGEAMALPALRGLYAGTEAAAGAGRALGAMGLGEGTAAEGAAALRNVTGAAAATYPTAVGSMYGEAVDRGDPTRMDAAKAALLGIPYSVMEGTELTMLGGLFKGAKAAAAGEGMMAGAKAVAYDAGKAFLNEGFTEGAQTIMEQSFRPDRTMGERAHDVLNAMFLGGLGGGAMGAAASGAGHVLRMFNTVPADQVAQTPGVMEDAVDASLGRPREPAANQTPSQSDAVASVNPVEEPVAEAPAAPIAPTTAAEPVVDPARPYAQLPDNDLLTRLGAAPADSPVRAALNAEAAARVRQYEAERRGDTTETERQQAQKEFNTQLAKDAGIKNAQNKTLQSMNVSDLASAYDVVEAKMQDAFERGKKPAAAVQKLNDFFGIFDKDGAKRDLNSELAVWQDVKNNPPNAQTARKADEQIAQINTLIERQGQVTARKADFEQQLKTREEERVASAKAEQDLLKARELTSRPVQALLNEQTATMKGPTKSAFLAGFRSGMEDGPMPVRGPIRNGWQLAKTYSEAQQLVEKNDGLSAEKAAYEGAEPAQRLAQLVGENGRGNAAGAAVGPESAVQGAALRQGQEGLVGAGVESPAAESLGEGRKEGAAGVSEGPLTDFVGSDKTPVRVGDTVRLTSRSGTETVLARVDKVIGSGDSARVLLVDERGGKRSMGRESFATSAAVERGVTTRRQVARTEAPEWAKWAEDRTKGSVVWSKDNIALLRGFDQNDQPIYMPVKGGKADLGDVDNYKGALFTSKEIQELRDAKKARVKQEAEDYAKNPDGPFQKERTPASPNFPPQIAEFGRALLKSVGLDARVYFTTRADARDGDIFTGPYSIINAVGLEDNINGMATSFSNGDYIVTLDMERGRSTEAVLETLAHEIGHIIEITAFRNADAKTRDAIFQAFERWVTPINEQSLYGLVQASRRAYYTAQESLAGKHANYRMGQFTPETFNYETEFAEWFADQVARWTMTSQKPQGLVEKFFYEIGQKLRQLYATLAGKEYLPTQEMKKFLDNLGPANFAPVITQIGTKFQKDAAPGPRPSAASRQAAVASAQNASSAQDQTAPRSAPETAQAVGQRIGKMVQTLTAAESLKKPKSWLGNKWLENHLAWTTLHHIAEHFGNVMPQLRDLVKAQELRRNISNRWAAIGLQAISQFNKLGETAQKTLGHMMAMSTELQIDPRKEWEKHTHIFAEVKNGTMSPAYRDMLKDKHGKLRAEYQGGVRSGLKAAYDALIDMNMADRHAHHAIALQRAMELDPNTPKEIKEALAALGNPMENFLRHANSKDSPADLRDFWQKESDRVMAVAKDWIAARNKALNKKKDDNLVSLLYDKTAKERGALKAYPYFHLGRSGEHFVAFELNKRDDGTVEPAVLQKLQKLLDRALPEKERVIINDLSRQSKVYLRVQSDAVAQEIKALLASDANKHLIKEKSVSSGPRDTVGDTAPSQRLINQMLADLESSTSFAGNDDEIKQSKEQMKKFIREFARDVLPDVALDKSMAPRQNILGYDADMIRSFAERTQQGGLSLSRVAGSAKIMDTLQSMHKSMMDAKRDDKGDETLKHRLYTEAARREYQRVIEEHSTLIETLKALNHSYFLGFNPSHALLQQVSIPVLLLPELGKRSGVGFMRASSAIGRATTDAFKIMGVLGKAAAQAKWKAASTTLTPDMLEQALPGEKNKAKREFLMRVINSGGIESGSESRELGRMAEGKRGELGKKLDTYTQFASAMGYYSETSTRLIAALSSYEVNQGTAKTDDDKFDDALHTISETMFNFANYNVARRMGKNGFLGPATPLVTAFMSYNAQLMEKLYRETYKALNDGNAETRAEAKRFLLGHAAAVTAIAGVMGLPFATAFAAGFDKLKDWTDPDEGPHDSRAAFRNYMHMVFGETAGDVLARGLPRLTGSDISERAGEGNLAPFSQFMTDRGSMREAFGRLEQRSFGSPASAVSNIMDGIDKLGNGDLFGGARQFMPQGIKNMFDAYRMTDQGYVDAKGHKLPLSVGAEDQLRKLIGFKGDREADYNEVKQIDERQKRRLAQESGPIMKNLIDAATKGDREAFNDYLQQAQEYDAQHPTRAILPKLESRINSSTKNQAIESMTGMPANIQLEDARLMDNLRWYQGRAR